jgi:enediyne biosynthesis protein E3
MTSLLGRLRVRMFMPDPSETRMSGKPGWSPSGPEQVAQLERVGDSFMVGLRVGLEAVPLPEIEERLDLVDPEFRGFAYEGCGMGLAVTDSLSLRPHRLREFLDGAGAAHVYMAYIGVGWGLARIPRMRWRAVIPADPIQRWLALDGLGFHQGFFQTVKYVTNHWHPNGFPAWPGDQLYALRAFDQGLGRALWFVNGANPRNAAACIARFPKGRQADLWAGVGLASVYAGGVDAGGLAELRDLAGFYRPELCQGAVWAAATRVMTGLVTPHTELAVKSHCEMTPEDAHALMNSTRVNLPPDGRVPAYEIWRQRIQQYFP